MEQQVATEARRKEKQHRRGRTVERPLPGHRDERRYAGAAADQEHRPAVLDPPDEMLADRFRQLDLVADLDHLVEEGRHLAVVQSLDRQFDMAGGAWRRNDRIAALGAIAVWRRQPHADMLA